MVELSITEHRVRKVSGSILNRAMWALWWRPCAWDFSRFSVSSRSVSLFCKFFHLHPLGLNRSSLKTSNKTSAAVSIIFICYDGRADRALAFRANGHGFISRRGPLNGVVLRPLDQNLWVPPLEAHQLNYDINNNSFIPLSLNWYFSELMLRSHMTSSDMLKGFQKFLFLEQRKALKGQT